MLGGKSLPLPTPYNVYFQLNMNIAKFKEEICVFWPSKVTLPYLNNAY